MARVRQRACRGGSCKRSRCSRDDISPPLKRARISYSRSRNTDNTIQMQNFKRKLANMKRYNDWIKQLNVELSLDLKKHHNIRNQIKKVIICECVYSVN